MRLTPTISHGVTVEPMSPRCLTTYHVKKGGCDLGIRDRNLLARPRRKHRGPRAHRSLAIEVRSRKMCEPGPSMVGGRVR